MNDNSLPHPFNNAKRIAGLNVRLRPEDIVAVAHDLNHIDADALLQRHGSTIAAEMLTAGVDAAIRIMAQEGQSS